MPSDAANSARLHDGLTALGFDILPSTANFLLCHLPKESPSAAEVVANCRAQGLFIRDTTTMGVRDAIRIAVKDQSTNDRMTGILANTCHAGRLTPGIVRQG